MSFERAKPFFLLRSDSDFVTIYHGPIKMSSYDLLIINGIVVTASDIGAYDIAIKEEKIALLAPTGSLAGIEAKRVIDAEGGCVMVAFSTFLFFPQF